MARRLGAGGCAGRQAAVSPALLELVRLRAIRDERAARRVHRDATRELLRWESEVRRVLAAVGADDSGNPRASEVVGGAAAEVVEAAEAAARWSRKAASGAASGVHRAAARRVAAELGLAWLAERDANGHEPSE